MLTERGVFIFTVALLVMVCPQSPAQAQSKTGQSNAIILQNQGAGNSANRAIILQNPNAARAPALAAPKALPPDPCRGGTACK